MNILWLAAKILGLLFCIIFPSLASAEKKTKLINNGYDGVVIAIHPAVQEDEGVINAIKKMMVEASEVMYKATGWRAYFKKITILVPNSWTRESYESVGNLTFEKADIRIAPPVPELGDNPYASSYETCGKQGDYIHLTPDYVVNDNVGNKWGPRGRVVVHEWAHYWWGVKDEYPLGATEEQRHENSFYLSLSGIAEFTRCSASIRGLLLEGDGPCRYNYSTRLPLIGCEFDYRDVQQPIGLHSSLMFWPFIPEVHMFCHDDPNDALNMHNKEAKNNQNRLCNQRSIWDVIMQSVDFENGKRNTPGAANRVTEPIFTVAKAQKRRAVFVLDSSGSMSGEKIVNVKRVSEIFLRHLIGHGTFVGVVDFDSSARTLSPLREIKQGDSSRTTLINALQGLKAVGGTGIGYGILEGIQALETQSANGGHLFVLTDGEENTGPTVSSIAKEVVSKGVIVHSIFLGLTQIESAASLVTLSEASGGEWYYSDDAVASLPELTSIFAALARPDDGDFSSASVQISSSVEEKQANEEINSTVAIDGSVGNQTSFVFSWSSSIQPTIELTPPISTCIYSNVHREGVMYCEEVHETDAVAKLVTFNIPGTAEVGFWKYNISSVASDVFTVTVTSAASAEGSYPVVVLPKLTITNVSGSEAAVVVTKVFQNTIPVLGATVTAKITRPKGDPVHMDLFDNGAGSDVTKNDGVYSRYFSQFNAQGRYSIQVNVFKNGDDPPGVANVPRAYPNSDDGSFVNIPDISGVKIEGVLQRIATSSGLSYTGTVPDDSDIFPPNKITDLEVKQVNADNVDAGLMLEFTAPGDDYDFGLATRYDIRYTTGSSTALLTNFTDQSRVESASAVEPKASLSKEEIVISLPSANRTAKVLRIAVAMRSFDEVDNPSEISNVAIATFFTEPPPPPPSSASSSFSVSIWIFLGALAAVGLNI